MYNGAPYLPPRPQRSNKNNWMPWLFAGGAIMAGFAMLLVVLGVIGAAYLSQDRIASGVSVAGIDLGNQTLEDAIKQFKQQAASQSWAITVRDQERNFTIPMAQLGLGFDVDATMERAKSANKNATIYPVYAVNLSQTQEGLIGLSEQFNIPAENGQPGRSIEIPVVLDRLRSDPSGELADGVLDLTMMVIEPEPEVVLVDNNASSPAPTYNGATTTHVVEPGQELALIAKEYNVDMDMIVQMNGIENPSLIFVGQQLTIPAAGIYEPSASDAPTPSTSRGKAIVVDVSEQRIYAYEDGSMVHSHITSTGRSETPTVLGDYSIYVKYRADDMQGADYFLPQVPYVMYFYQGYGIHGTYWHNSFGRPMSHGCVNLPVEEAEWFFNWAEVGTPVRVIA